MSLVLDPPIRHGCVVVAALSRHSISARGSRTRPAFFAAKRPVAVLIRTEGRPGIVAFRVDGTALSPEALEELCPGAAARFSALTDPGPLPPG